jgi:hypothetical protein
MRTAYSLTTITPPLATRTIKGAPFTTGFLGHPRSSWLLMRYRIKVFALIQSIGGAANAEESRS